MAQDCCFTTDSAQGNLNNAIRDYTGGQLSPVPNKQTVNAQCTYCGSTPVHVAAACCQWDLLPVLVGCEPNLCIEDRKGRTALIRACERKCNSIPCDKLGLLMTSQNINTQENRHRRTALLSALHNGNFHCVEALLECGADVTIRDKFMQNALHIACKMDVPDDLLDQLLEVASVDHDQIESTVYTALATTSILTGNWQEAVLKTHINTKDTYGNTPLHYAAIFSPMRAGTSDRIRILRQNGADLMLSPTNNTTPLHWYLYCADRNMISPNFVDALVSPWVLEAQDRFNNTPLHVVMHRHPQTFFAYWEQVRDRANGIRTRAGEPDVSFLRSLITTTTINMSNNISSVLGCVLYKRRWDLVPFVIGAGADAGKLCVADTINAAAFHTLQILHFTTQSDAPGTILQQLYGAYARTTNTTVKILAFAFSLAYWDVVSCLLDNGLDVNQQRIAVTIVCLAHYHWRTFSRCEIREHSPVACTEPLPLGIPDRIAARVITPVNADMASRYSFGKRPIEYAVHYNDWILTEQLLRHGYRINRPNLLQILCILTINRHLGDTGHDVYDALPVPPTLRGMMDLKQFLNDGVL